MKILSVSSVYPNPAEPGLGLFVRSRLQTMAAQAELKLIAPVPLLDYSHPERRVFRPGMSPFSRQDGPVEVYHPRWLFPPFGTPVNVVCEFARLMPLAARIHRTFPFDLIDAHFAYPDGCAAALLARAFRVPFTITLRGSETMFDAYHWRRAAIRAALRQAAAVIGVSDELRAYAISRGALPQHTFTIPNGIDAGIFYRRDLAAARQQLKLPSNRRLLLTAGELIEAKGHHHVVHALKTLLEHGIDAELLIAGATARGGPLFERSLRQLVHDQGLDERVRFLGWVSPAVMAELFSAADVFCLASFTEGWPNVVNEALACGAPVVVTSVGGVAAMVKSPDYGIIVPQKDQKALDEAVCASLTHSWDRTEIARWGGLRSWSRVASDVLDVFGQILPSQGGI
jgi:glycosyltransferase involved in cell wall biosynthesis